MNLDNNLTRIGCKICQEKNCYLEIITQLAADIQSAAAFGPVRSAQKPIQAPRANEKCKKDNVTDLKFIADLYEKNWIQDSDVEKAKAYLNVHLHTHTSS
jgi:hypothetical protein